MGNFEQSLHGAGNLPNLISFNILESDDKTELQSYFIVLDTQFGYESHERSR